MGQSATGRAPSPASSLQISEHTLKHLEMVQAVIGRMGSNSFAVKNWTVAISTAALALATREGLIGIVLAAVVVVVFWGLDGYYLMQERRYRRLFDLIRNGAEITAFDMNASQFAQKTEGWLRACFSSTVFGLYAAMIVAVGAITAYFLRPWR